MKRCHNLFHSPRHCDGTRCAVNGKLDSARQALPSRTVGVSRCEGIGTALTRDGARRVSQKNADCGSRGGCAGARGQHDADNQSSPVSHADETSQTSKVLIIESSSNGEQFHVITIESYKELR